MKKAALFGGIVFLLLLLTGCGLIRIEEEPRKPLEYSIVEEGRLPAELSALIQEKKEREFGFTYKCEDDLFLVKGY